MNVMPNNAESRIFPWIPGLAVALVTLLVFLPALSCGFVNLDDPVHVTANPHVQAGLSWSGIRWAFANADAVHWFPLTWLSHMLDVELYGLNPQGHHLTNVLLHAANAALVFAMLRTLTGVIWKSFFVALLFALHPLRVESVVWITERKDVLSAFFGLLSLIFYIRYAGSKAAGQRPDRPGYGLSFLFLTLGLMSKSMLVSLPFVMLLLDVYPLRRPVSEGVRRLVSEKLIFIVPVAAVGTAMLLIQHAGGGEAVSESFSLNVRCLNALKTCYAYWGKMLWPAGLAVPYRSLPVWTMWQGVLSGMVLAGLSLFLFRLRKGQPLLLMGWLWFFITLLPVSNLVPFGVQVMADRFTYIPSIGLLVALVWGACELVKKSRVGMRVLVAIGLCTSAALSAATMKQIGYWKSSETLFTHALSVTGNNSIPHVNLGHALFAEGRLGEAVMHYREALKLDSGNVTLQVYLATAVSKTGDAEEALGLCRQAVRMDPNHVPAHFALAVMLAEQALADEAIRQYLKTIELDPEHVPARYNLARLYAQNGRLEEAVVQYRQVIEQDPMHAEACNSLGVTLDQLGDTGQAIEQFKKALALKPDFRPAAQNLQLTLKKKWGLDWALRQAREQVSMNPDDADAHCSYGVALLNLQRGSEAVAEFERAIQLRPGHAAAHYNLGRACLFQGDIDRAVTMIEEAVALEPGNALFQAALDRARQQ